MLNRPSELLSSLLACADIIGAQELCCTWGELWHDCLRAFCVAVMLFNGHYRRLEELIRTHGAE